jgi:hypothetical protein
MHKTGMTSMDSAGDLAEKEASPTVKGIKNNQWVSVLIGYFDWRLMLLTLVIGGLMAVIQFGGRGLLDIDAYYHTKMAYLMHQSLTPTFTWLPLTILSPARYVDHHWLFHILLIPFTFGDLILGGKLAAVVFSTLAFVSAGVIMKSMRIPAAELWTLAVLAAGSGMLFRLSMTRGQSLSLLWMMITIYMLFKRKDIALFFVGMTYVWLYNAFPLFLVLAGVYFVLTWLMTGELRWRMVFLAGAGIAAGLIINPFFPRNLQFIYEHYIAKLDISAVAVGMEWYPYTTTELLKNAGGAMIALIGGVAALSINRQRINLQTAFFLILSIIFGYMVFESKRFVEYYPIFPILFCAFAWQTLIPDLPMKRWAAVGLTAVIVVIAFFNIQTTRDDLASYTPPEYLKGGSEWLAKNTPAGSMVFQTDWDDFPRLFFYNTHNTYIVGLDPTYLSLANQSLFNKWVDLTQGRTSDKGLSADIISTFNSCYAISDLEHTGFIGAASSDPAMKEVYSDDTSVVYQFCQ